MRSGRLLAEESPNNLMRNFRRPSLEDAFLKLCMDEQQTESMENATISNATIQYTEEAQQQQPQGDHVDYAEGVVSQTDVTETSVHRQRHSNSRVGSIDSTTSSSVINNSVYCFIIINSNKDNCPYRMRRLISASATAQAQKYVSAKITV